MARELGQPVCPPYQFQTLWVDQMLNIDPPGVSIQDNSQTLTMILGDVNTINLALKASYKSTRVPGAKTQYVHALIQHVHR